MALEKTWRWFGANITLQLTDHPPFPVLGMPRIVSSLEDLE